MSRLGDIFNLVGGGTPTTSIEEYWGNGIPWISSADIDHSGRIVYRRRVTPSGVANSTTSVVPRGTIIVVTRVGLGKVAQLTEDTCFSQDIQALLAKETAPAYSSRFLMYQLMFIMQTVKYNGRGTTISGITKKQLADVSLYFPPLSEQERIVARIEELFSQLDAGVETLKKTKAQLAVYRQAVLKEAFEKVSARVLLGSVSESRLGKMLDSEKNIGIPRRYLRNINVRWHSFDLSDLSEMPIEENEVDKYSLRKGDLVICEGGEPGRCAVWKSDDVIFYQKALHRVRFTDSSNPKFYMYYLWYAAQTGQLKSLFTGTGIKHLTGQSLVKVLVPTAERITQDSIVNEIETHLSVCDSIEHTVDLALQQAEAMRQSILKDAFEGRL